MNITVEEIRRIIVASAGAPESGASDADFADTSFDELGYESLALMETASAIEREFGVSVPDDLLFEARTPRELAELVRSAKEAAAA
ncbi:actinorhodin polyketide synthase [Streptomyces sp. WAC 01325]|uniref:acyl carrier protein n=1 Tax=Streptomyces TaxID=1883 RepID=UPI000F87AA07|nr:acyl carrier protein [Streptomyces sp. WAC 01325]MCZ4607405.1 acyl carrier protein [Streptomyces sp. Lzd4kr]RSN07111.1 actinorhodin polyketide synthase [Streptomyces sp. WAC 01325]WCH93250.1 acyl carrier protein [Streptomyces moderatus]